MKKISKKTMTKISYKGTRGGKRPGAGRKRIHPPGISHLKRETVSSRTPLYISIKLSTRIKSKTALVVFKRALEMAHLKGLRVTHFSLLPEEIHFIAEASDNKILTKGMRALTISMAKGLHAGNIQKERYCLQVLKNSKDVQNALHRVFFQQDLTSPGKSITIDGFNSILFHPNAKKMIQKFSKLKGITPKVGKILETFELPLPQGALLKKAIMELG